MKITLQQKALNNKAKRRIEDVKQRLRDHAQQKNISITDLCAFLGISRNQFYGWMDKGKDIDMHATNFIKIVLYLENVEDEK